MKDEVKKTLERIKELAKDMGLDTEEFEKVIDSKESEDKDDELEEKVDEIVAKHGGLKWDIDVEMKGDTTKMAINFRMGGDGCKEAIKAFYEENEITGVEVYKRLFQFDSVRSARMIAGITESLARRMAEDLAKVTKGVSSKAIIEAWQDLLIKRIKDSLRNIIK